MDNTRIINNLLVWKNNIIKDKNSWESNYIYLDELIGKIKRKDWILESFKYFHFLKPINIYDFKLIPVLFMDLKTLRINEYYNLDINRLIDFLSESSPPRYFFIDKKYFNTLKLELKFIENKYNRDNVLFQVFQHDTFEQNYDGIYRALYFIRSSDLK